MSFSLRLVRFSSGRSYGSEVLTACLERSSSAVNPSHVVLQNVEENYLSDETTKVNTVLYCTRVRRVRELLKIIYCGNRNYDNSQYF